MTARAGETTQALLTRLFLRQFLENDLVSHDADRSQLLAVVGAGVVCLTLFLSTFMSFGYIGPMVTAGPAAVAALNDKFFYIGLAMIVTALVATSQWDALTVNARDAAILEPLPLGAGAIRRAKMTAVAMLGGAVALAVNACPSFVFPWLLVFNFRDLSMLSLLMLMVVHAVTAMAAAAFGYVTVIAIRETLAAILGRRWFTLVSPWAQGLMIVWLGGALLLLPPAATGVAERGFDDWRAMSPPMWFVGAYDMAVGGIVADYPRGRMTSRQATNDRRATALYASRRDQFPMMARRAGLALLVSFAIAAAAYLWNARRLPSLTAAPPPAFRRRWRLGGRLADTLLVRDAAARAGFYFTLAAMWRSNTHRITLACAAAAGVAMAVVALPASALMEGGGASPRLLSMQPLLYGALLVGFRHIIRVPAELRANWGFQLAWRGRERPFVTGAKCAAIVGLVIPALLLVLPLFVFTIGPRAALLHAAYGLAGATLLLEAVMVTYGKVPFTCNYVPSENMKALAPLYVVAFIIGATMFARMQYDALFGTGAATLWMTLAAGLVIVRVLYLRRDRLPQMPFDEAPVTFQRLGLDR